MPYLKCLLDELILGKNLHLIPKFNHISLDALDRLDEIVVASEVELTPKTVEPPTKKFI